MNREDILGLFDKCDFDELTEESFEENIIAHLPEDFHFSYEYGVSKCVILPEQCQYVIKIPFMGTYDSSYCSSSSSSNNTSTDYDDYYNSEFYRFHNANTDFHHDWDYCFTEMTLYEYAKKYSIHYPFCKTKLIGKTKGDNYPIYIQERAEVFSNMDKQAWNVNPSKMEIRSSLICREKGVYEFNSTWLADALSYYGEKTFKRLLQFINDFNIEDLHNDNVGYIKNKPVLIDYSSWHE